MFYKAKRKGKTGNGELGNEENRVMLGGILYPCEGCSQEDLSL